MVIQISDSAERGKIFVWGDYGQSLKNIDEKRIHAIAQSNPNHYLAMISNSEISEIIKEIVENGELSESTKQKIQKSVSNDSLFSEIAKLLRVQTDMLSIGSFLTGEKEKNKAFMKFFKDGE